MDEIIEQQPDIERPQYNLHGNLRNNVKKPANRPYANIGIVNQLYEETNNHRDIGENSYEEKNTTVVSANRPFNLVSNTEDSTAAAYRQSSPAVSRGNGESKPIPSPRAIRNRPQFFLGESLDSPPISKPGVAPKPSFPTGGYNMSSRPPEATTTKQHPSLGNKPNVSPNPGARTTNRPHFSLADTFNRPPSPIRSTPNKPHFTQGGAMNRPPSPVEAIGNRPKLSVANTVNRPPSPLGGTVRRPSSPVGGTVNRTYSPITEGGSIRSYHSGGEGVSRSYSMPEKSLPKQNSLQDAPYPGAYMEGRYGAMPLDAPLLNPGK